MTRIVLIRPSAEADLIGIWRYTSVRWGPEQADRYLDELRQGIRLLATNPEAGADRSDVRRDHRVLFVKNHAVYYRATTTQVRIVRVLHGSMDVRGQLRGSTRWEVREPVYLAEVRAGVEAENTYIARHGSFADLCRQHYGV